MKTQRIVIEIKSDLYKKNTDFINQIADILVKENLMCNMSYYEGINRTEFLNECEYPYEEPVIPEKNMKALIGAINEVVRKEGL